MILKLISLLNFKNYESINIDFSNHVNCFLGNNGVGKTNLLDAIYYLSFCKSFYNSTEFDNIKYGETFFMIKGRFLDSDGGVLEINGSLKGKQKQFKYNNKAYKKLSDHIGKIPLVSITPMDANIIMGSGDERRRFVNKLLSQLDKEYLRNIIGYNKTLRQRNTLLKSSSSSMTNEDLLLAYDKALCNFGHKIHAQRKKFMSLIINSIQKYYDFISDKSENIDVIYESQLSTDSFEELLNKTRHKDKLLMFTTVGVHRDDFIFKMNSNSLKKSGSQGQQKTFLISLKLGCFDLIKDKTQITPILLLDDIFDKLDYNRVEKIIQILNKNESGQVFITDTSIQRMESVITHIDKDCKYFIFNKDGLHEEKIKK